MLPTFRLRLHKDSFIIRYTYNNKNFRIRQLVVLKAGTDPVASSIFNLKSRITYINKKFKKKCCLHLGCIKVI